MTITTAADRGFEKPLAAMLASLRSSQQAEYRVFVLHEGFDRTAQCRAAGSDEGTTWIDIGRDAADRLRSVGSYGISSSAFRLLLPDLLPPDTDRVVYLDADVIVRRSLEPLWVTDLEQHTAAATRDAVIPWAACPRALPWNELGISPGTGYFNTGVLVLHMQALRERQLANKAVELAEKHRFRYADQCTFNAVLVGRIQQLAPEWNLQVGHMESDRSMAWLVESPEELGRAMDDPAIVHFNTGPLGRPWLHGCSHPLRSLWYEAIDRTAWAGWRPSLPREMLDKLSSPGALTGIKCRLGLAARALVRGE